MWLSRIKWLWRLPILPIKGESLRRRHKCIKFVDYGRLETGVYDQLQILLSSRTRTILEVLDSLSFVYSFKIDNKGTVLLFFFVFTLLFYYRKTGLQWGAVVPKPTYTVVTVIKKILLSKEGKLRHLCGVGVTEVYNHTPPPVGPLDSSVHQQWLKHSQVHFKLSTLKRKISVNKSMNWE